jgi:hypothetical protein
VKHLIRAVAIVATLALSAVATAACGVGAYDSNEKGKVNSIVSKPDGQCDILLYDKSKIQSQWLTVEDSDACLYQAGTSGSSFQISEDNRSLTVTIRQDKYVDRKVAGTRKGAACTVVRHFKGGTRTVQTLQTKAECNKTPAAVVRTEDLTTTVSIVGRRIG